MFNTQFCSVSTAQPCTLFLPYPLPHPLSSTYSLPLILLSNCRGISPWVGDSPPRLWDLPGSPCIRVLPGAPRLSEEPLRSPHWGGRQHLRRGPAFLWPPAGRRLANAGLRWLPQLPPGSRSRRPRPWRANPMRRDDTAAGQGTGLCASPMDPSLSTPHSGAWKEKSPTHCPINTTGQESWTSAQLPVLRASLRARREGMSSRSLKKGAMTPFCCALYAHS